MPSHLDEIRQLRTVDPLKSHPTSHLKEHSVSTGIACVKFPFTGGYVTPVFLFVHVTLACCGTARPAHSLAGMVININCNCIHFFGGVVHGPHQLTACVSDLAHS